MIPDFNLDDDIKEMKVSCQETVSKGLQSETKILSTKIYFANNRVAYGNREGFKLQSRGKGREFEVIYRSHVPVL